MITCPLCDQQQFSLFDKEYLNLFDICWCCDQKRFEQGELSLVEFEEREYTANHSAKNKTNYSKWNKK